MNCDKADKLLMDSLIGALATEDRRTLDEHLAECQRCREEVAGMESLWEDLGDLEESRLEVPSDKLTRRFRLALASVAPVPLVPTQAETILAEKLITEAAITEAAQAAMDACNPIDDVRGSARYRRLMVRNLTKTAVTEVWGKISEQ